MNFSLPDGVQDLYLGQKSYLGHILPQSSTKIRGPQSVSWPFYPTTGLVSELRKTTHDYVIRKLDPIILVIDYFNHVNRNYLPRLSYGIAKRER